MGSEYRHMPSETVVRRSLTPKQRPGFGFALLLVALLMCGCTRLRVRPTSLQPPPPVIYTVPPAPPLAEESQPVPPTIRFTSNSLRIESGQNATLEWRVSNADIVTLAGVGAVPSSGQRVVHPE